MRQSECFPWILVVWAAVAAGCVGGKPEPVEIVLNEEVCSHCRMAVSQREFAAEIVTVGGTVDFFDDIGCLVAWVKKNPPREEAGLFVVDYETGDWLDARAATFLRSDKLPTPMSSGIAAFASRASAETAAQNLEGRVLEWSALVDQVPP